MTAQDDSDLQPVVAAELEALATLLDGLGESSWDHPSMCAGWRVREVVAHMTMATRYSAAEFEAELRECAFDFTALSNRLAERDGARATASLVADLQSATMAQWAPPGGGFTGALNHVVIHGLDITIALGLDRRPPDQTIRTVLNGLTEGAIHARFGTGLDGIELRPTDLGWTYGSGRPVVGTAGELALVLCGRTVPGVRLAEARGTA